MADFPPQLVSQIARRKAIVVIGSGVSAHATIKGTANRPKTWGNFLDFALRELGGSRGHISRALKEYRYLDACFYLKEAHGDEDWLRLISDEYSVPEFVPAELHKAIQDLDCRIVISLNFDQIYERLCQQGTEGTYIVKNYYDTHLRRCLVGQENYIFKMHGSIDAPERLIFNSDDYARARIQHKHFYDVISALALTNTFLFIGCGTADPDVKLILEDQKYSTDSTSHYFLTGDRITSEEVNLLKKTRGLNIIKYSNLNHHYELVTMVKELVQLVAEKRQEISASMTW
jgi:hypothetical protein